MNAEPLTVPEGLLRSATSVLRYHLLTRYNCQISDDRKQTYLDAKELLAADPALEQVEHAPLRRRIDELFELNAEALN